MASGTGALRDLRAVARQWRDAAGVAGIAFLSLMVVATALLVAGKLQFPSLGSGASPVDILRSIGLVALASLGVTIELDDLALSVLPLGALCLAALLVYRLSRDSLRPTLRHPLVEGLRIGLPFGVICLFASLLFRFGGDVPVAASEIESAVVGFVWGSIFGAAAAASAAGGSRAIVARVVARLPSGVRGGLQAGAVISGLAVYGGLAGVLCVAIGRLLSSELPRGFGAGDALAAIVYLVAFLPNAVAAVFALGMGGSLSMGAQVEVSGQEIGPMRDISVFDGSGPATLVLLLLIPLVTTTVAGAWVHRRARNRDELARSVAIGALVFAALVGVTAAVGDARLGGGLVRNEGFGLVAIDAGKAALLALAWGSIGAFVGAAIDGRWRAVKKGRPR